MPNTGGNTTWWEIIGSNQVAVIVTIVCTLIGIFLLVIPSIIKHFKSKAKQKQLDASRKNKSPYTTAKAVTPPDFVGRKRELKLLHDCLLKGESISLLGNRRIGKSSLLETWNKYLSNHSYKTLLLNGQNGEGASLQAFLQCIIKDAVAVDISADDAANRLVQWAEKQYSQKQKKPIILVDECEAILQQCPHRFWERVRGTLGQIVWVFSSKQPLDTLYKHQHKTGSPFENQLKTLWLGLLDKDSAKQLIEKGGFSKEQQRVLATWAGCHPFYLQCLGGHLWHNKNENTSIIVLDAYKMEAKRHLDDLWKSLSSKEKDKLLSYSHTQQVIDSTALRSKGVITQEGHPFAKIFTEYIKKQH